jgi:diacylglycerol kinase (ATP)
MRNQPSYNFLKNTSYALKGLKDIVSSEKSFKIELVIIIFLSGWLLVAEIDLIEKVFMFSSMFFVLIAEAINSSIERVVDLVTKEYHPMAGRAKDVGSSIVFLSIVHAFIIWICLMLKNFNSIS